MSNTLATPSSQTPMNPFVLANYRVRTLSFVMAFAIFAAQLFDKHTSPVTWGLLVLQFFIYPHFLFWRARQASHPLDAELKNLLVDAFLLGLWIWETRRPRQASPKSEARAGERFEPTIKGLEADADRKVGKARITLFRLSAEPV